MKSKLPYTQTKKQFSALLVTGLAVSGFFLFKNNAAEKQNNPAEITFSQNKPSENKILLSDFNPNELDSKQWQNLGFSEKQAATILKYKQSIGGEFTSKEQFKKCFAVSEKKYSEIAAFLLLPEKKPAAVSISKFSNSYPQENLSDKKIVVTQKFNPDYFTQSQWEGLGFSEKQATAILKYKNYLGGSFISKQKFKECFVINETNYQKLEPFLLLPEKKDNHKINSYEKTSTIYSSFDPNVLDAQGWRNLGFSEKQADVIINYKNKKLQGRFRSLEEIQACFVISEKKFEELKPYILLNIENQAQKKIAESVQQKNATDFQKTDLNQITYQQLIEFGFDKKSAGNFVGFRKKLGGFINKNQIFETYDIDRELAEKITEIAPLNSSNIEKYNLADAPESWLRTHPYFRYSADKIIFYRVSYPDDKKIWKFIKVKPEYEAKMRLYLKD